MKLSKNPLRLIGLVTYRAGVGALGLLFGLVPSLTMAQNATGPITVKVVHAESGKPVHSIIVAFPPDDGSPKGATDSNGEMSLATCVQGMMIQAWPEEDTYHYSRKVFCQESEILLRVTTRRVASILQTNLEKAVVAAEWGVAALAANELSWLNLRDGEGVAGAEAERLTYVYSAQALGVAESFSFDRVQGWNVMAPALKDAIYEFQSESGIKVNGKLDYITLYNLSGTTSAALRLSPLKLPR